MPDIDMNDIKKRINAAQTREELRAISYEVFRKSGSNIKLDNKVNKLCIQREVQLGLL